MASFFTEQAWNSPRIANSTHSSELEHSLRRDHRQTPFRPSLHEGISLAATSAAPNVPCTATRHTLGGHIISASVHAPVSQLPARSFDADSRCAPNSFYAIGAAQAKCPEHPRVEGGRPCMGHAERKTVPDAMYVPEVQIGANQVPYPGHGSTHARNDPPLSCRGWAEEDLGPLSQDILRDADSLLSVAPNVLAGNFLYGRNWTIESNRIRIDESVITCQCTDQFKVKEIKTHLQRKHEVNSNSKSYKCFWPECISNKPMTQFSSLVRHIRESHGPVDWRCLTCGEKFTRDATLLKHFDKCAGRSKLRG